MFENDWGIEEDLLPCTTDHFPLGQTQHTQPAVDIHFLPICNTSQHLRFPEPTLHALGELPGVCDDFTTLASVSLLSVLFHLDK